ncbi:hypothetical protein [uncultured Ruegeria sp.]|uniref:hypothetical protein n=1 Tax=uncultured Ruegeria sp. TaxID=259304 RepID=UPI00260AE96F|nr:hypothetical protein [uncultured Ruegeria sp.]
MTEVPHFEGRTTINQRLEAPNANIQPCSALCCIKAVDDGVDLPSATLPISPRVTGQRQAGLSEQAFSLQRFANPDRKSIGVLGKFGNLIVGEVLFCSCRCQVDQVKPSLFEHSSFIGCRTTFLTDGFADFAAHL